MSDGEDRGCGTDGGWVGSRDSRVGSGVTEGRSESCVRGRQRSRTLPVRDPDQRHSTEEDRDDPETDWRVSGELVETPETGRRSLNVGPSPVEGPRTSGGCSLH